MTLEKIKNEQSTIEGFLVSEKYLSLKKELAESVSNIDTNEIGESDQDIAPVFDYFLKETVQYGLSEVQAEKMFWQTIFAEIKDGPLKTVYHTIFPDIEKAEYVSARKLLVEELSKIIENLSHTLYANLSRKSVAMMVLKEEFYKLFPEVESLIEETEEEKKTKIKIPTGQMGDGSEEDQSIRSLEERRKELGNPYLVEERNWEIPNNGELLPGLIIIFQDRETKSSFTVEFLDYPRFNEDGELQVKVKIDSKEANIDLADMGLAAYTQMGLWNSRFIPINWKTKEKK